MKIGDVAEYTGMAKLPWCEWWSECERAFSQAKDMGIEGRNAGFRQGDRTWIIRGKPYQLREYHECYAQLDDLVICGSQTLLLPCFGGGEIWEALKELDGVGILIRAIGTSEYFVLDDLGFIERAPMIVKTENVQQAWALEAFLNRCCYGLAWESYFTYGKRDYGVRYAGTASDAFCLEVNALLEAHAVQDDDDGDD